MHMQETSTPLNGSPLRVIDFIKAHWEEYFKSFSKKNLSIKIIKIINISSC